MFWLKGGAGSGKTAWTSKLVQRCGGTVVAMHFCRHADAQTADPRRMLHSLAAQLERSVAGFARGAAAGGETLEELFEALLRAPLAAAPAPADGQRRVIVLDALDECESGGKNALLDLIARRFGKAGALPGWLRIVVTSRPEGDIIAKLAAFEPLAMECDGNDADARLYLAHLLRGKVAAADEAAAVERMLAKSEALFLYLDFVRQRLAMVRADAPATLAELDAFPSGLDGIYDRDFGRVFPGEDAWSKALPLLQALVAAREPPHVRVLAAALGWGCGMLGRAAATLIGSSTTRHNSALVASRRSWVL